MRKSATLYIADYAKVTAGVASIAATLLLSFPAPADARPSTRAYTCEGVRDLIDRRGAVVMNTKNRSVFKRFVLDRTYCAYGQSAQYTYAPTRDGSCRLRYCREQSRSNRN